jgi:exonuclease III
MINHDSFNLNGYKYIGTNRSKKRGGGVGMYISKQLSFKIRDDLAQNIEDVIESTFIEINKTTGKNIIIGLVYRPPNNKFEIFENAINTILYKVERENKICYLAGDYNIDLLKSESCDFSNRFIEQLFTSSFFPLINKPTRITAHTATHIDNICTNDLEKINYQYKRY